MKKISDHPPTTKVIIPKASLRDNLPEVEPGEKRNENSNEAVTSLTKDEKKTLLGDTKFSENITWKDITFQQHEESGKRIIQVINRETGEVMKSIPEPEFLDKVQQLQQASGVILNIHG